MADQFEGFQGGLESPATRQYLVAPNDSTDLPNIPRALFVNTGGAAVIRDQDGVDVTYNLTAGQVVTFRAVRVLATGTTATLVAWY